MHNHLIRSLSLAIRLWMCSYGEPCLTVELLEVVLDLIGVKLVHVIKHHYSQHPKSGDNILLDKLL